MHQKKNREQRILREIYGRGRNLRGGGRRAKEIWQGDAKERRSLRNSHTYGLEAGDVESIG